jgi:hypothetical protein
MVRLPRHRLWFETARLKLVYAGIPFDGVPMATCSDARSREEIVRLSVQRAGERGLRQNGADVAGAASTGS